MRRNIRQNSLKTDMGDDYIRSQISAFSDTRNCYKPSDFGDATDSAHRQIRHKGSNIPPGAWEMRTTCGELELLPVRIIND
jgi:hypothetical protein